MKIVLIGSPGAGKGTQAKILTKHFNIAHISTGDLLRDEINLKTDLGLKIADIINSGELVSDEIVATLINNRIQKDDCKNGFILDGYPRNVTQAQTLESIVGKIDKVILIYVPDDIIIERMNGRRSCEKCGQMYHLKYNPPKNFGVCDICNSPLIQRKDDNLETIQKRLNVYNEATSPLIDFYRKKDLLLQINGVDEIEVVSKELINSLSNL